jgi:flagellar protein FliJ
MQPVIRLAELDVDKAGRALAQMQQRLALEQGKIVQLEEYQQEYRLKLQTAGQAGISVDRLRLFDGFHQQLDRAIEQQKQVIVKVQQDQEALKALWQQKDMRFRSLQKMLERLKKDTSVLQSRIEQRNHDEYALRRPGKNTWE